MRILHNERIIIGLGVLSVIALLVGCGGGGGTPGLGGPADGNAPAINSASTSPSNIPHAGGRVSITSIVTDDVGVVSVTAVVTRPDGSNSVPLTMNAGSNNTYTCQYDAPQNNSPLDQTYSVVVTARDAAGNTTTSSAFTFRVLRDGPPNPPT